MKYNCCRWCDDDGRRCTWLLEAPKHLCRYHDPEKIGQARKEQKLSPIKEEPEMKQQCMGITQSGTQCRRMASSGNYCKQHDPSSKTPKKN
jgi:hypothetical protein